MEGLSVLPALDVYPHYPMHHPSRFPLQLVTGWFLLAGIAITDGAANDKDIRFTFIDPPIAPEPDFPGDARRAGLSPDPNARKETTTKIEFGYVRDRNEQGAMSEIVAGHIAAIAVTWADPNRFKTHEQTEGVVRRLLSAPAGSINSGSYCQTYTFVIWSQRLGQANIVARVEHTNGKTGRLLLFASGDAYLFAYEDGESKWWLGTWREKDQP